MGIVGQLSLVFAGYVVAILVNRTAFRRDHKVKQRDRLRAAYVDVFVAMNVTLATKYWTTSGQLRPPHIDIFREVARAMYVLAMLESDQTFMADIRALSDRLGNLAGSEAGQIATEIEALDGELNRFIGKIRESHSLLKAA